MLRKAYPQLMTTEARTYKEGIDLGDTLMPLLCFQLRKKVDFLAIFYCARRSGI